MSSVSLVAYPHCVNRYLERRLGFPTHIANQLRKNPYVSKRICSTIKYEVNNEGLYFADIPKNNRNAILSKDWVYIVEDKTVITILWRIPRDLFGSIEGAIPPMNQRLIFTKNELRFLVIGVGKRWFIIVSRNEHDQPTKCSKVFSATNLQETNTL